MSVPPDQPTRRVPVEPAVPRQVPVEPGVPVATAYAADDVYWREQILERLDSLRTWLMLVGTVAVLALGLAIWALAREQEDRSGSGTAARSEQIRNLRDDVDTLRSQLSNRATVGQLNDVSKQIAAASQGTPTTVPDNGATNALSKSISQLNQQVVDLGQRVKTLEESAAASQGQTPPGKTTRVPAR